jgi:hypothetical protein
MSQPFGSAATQRKTNFGSFMHMRERILRISGKMERKNQEAGKKRNTDRMKNGISFNS